MDNKYISEGGWIDKELTNMIEEYYVEGYSRFGVDVSVYDDHFDGIEISVMVGNDEAGMLEAEYYNLEKLLVDAIKEAESSQWLHCDLSPAEVISNELLRIAELINPAKKV